MRELTGGLARHEEDVERCLHGVLLSTECSYCGIASKLIDANLETAYVNYQILLQEKQAQTADIDKKFQAAVKELQAKCTHNEITEWQVIGLTKVAPDNSHGVSSWRVLETRCCKRCRKEMERRPCRP